MTAQNTKRNYRQYCGVAKALDLVGERWTLLLVRNLLVGPRRYGDLLAENPGITTNLLAARLQAMAKAGVVVKVDDDDGSGVGAGVQGRATVSRYALTPLGRAIDPVVQELGRFGQHLLTAPARAGERRDLLWAFSSLRRRYRGGLGVARVCIVAADAQRTRKFTFTEVASKLLVSDARAAVSDVIATATTAQWFAWYRSADATPMHVVGDAKAWRSFARSVAPPRGAAARSFF